MLDKHRWQEICCVLDEILELDEVSRDSALAQLEKKNAELARDVREYMEQDTESLEFLSTPLIQTEPMEGRMLGSYRLIRQLGQGGMGVIFLAHQEGDLNRKVAIKLLRPGFKTREILARFKNEQQILANLVHANIAQLYEVGKTESGQPYFVMEYVEGVPIDAWCQQRNLDFRARLALMIDVCKAVQFAHDNLVIHRDLKPANILVTQDGTPKLLDFGISKIVDSDYQALTITAHDATPMTPQYASPEQVKGEALTTASDIYTLGVICYELLTERRPYALTEESFSALTHAICHSQPLLPSRAVSRELGKFSADLDTLILKAMHKEPQRRYASASRLLEDIDNYLHGFPIKARKDTLTYRTKKLIQRHPVGSAAFAAMLLLLITSYWMLFQQYTAARASETKAQLASKQAQEENNLSQAMVAFFVEGFKDAGPNRKGDSSQTTDALLDRMSERLRQNQTMADEERAIFLTVLAEIYAELGYIHRARDMTQKALTLNPNANKHHAQSLHLLAHLTHPNKRLPLLKKALTCATPQTLGDTYPELRLTLAFTHLNLGQNAKIGRAHV